MNKARKHSQQNEPSKEEIVGLLFRLVEEGGARATDLSERLSIELEKRYEGIEKRWSREKISRVIWDAIYDGRLQYIPSTNRDLAEQIEEYYGRIPTHRRRLQTVVLNAESARQLASQAASVLFNLIRDVWGGQPNKSHVHIAWSGGRTPAILLESLAHEIVRRQDQLKKGKDQLLPNKIRFQSFVGMLGGGNPRFSPQAYFQHFYDNKKIPSQTTFVDLPVPGLVRNTAEELAALESLSVVRDSQEMLHSTDIVVASAGHWGAGHFSLCDYVRESCAGRPSMLQVWEQQEKQMTDGCLGDFMWRPIFRSDETGKKALEAYKKNEALNVYTLIDLDYLDNLVSNGKQVLLLLGPCTHCPKSKHELLNALMNDDRQLVTNLVVDFNTASEYLSENGT